MSADGPALTVAEFSDNTLWALHGTTWVQVPTPIGPGPGPGTSTDKALVRWNGTTGTAIQNGITVESDTGELQAGLGAVTTPSHTFLGRLTDGMYSVAAGSLGLTSNGVLGVTLASQTSGNTPNLAITDSTRTGAAGALQIGASISHTLNQTGTAAFTSLDIVQTVTAAGSGAQYLINGKAGAAGTTQVFSVTSAGIITGSKLVLGLGATGAGNLALQIGSTAQWGAYADASNLFWTQNSAKLLAFTSSATTDYFFSWTSRNLVAGTNQVIQSWVVNTALTGVTINNAVAFTGAAGISQIGVQLAHTINQTSTAAFTSLDMVRTETGVGSGAQYFINAKAGAAGTTQVFVVTNAGRVLTGDGTSALPANAFVSDATMGFYRISASQLGVSFAGTNYLALTGTGSTAGIISLQGGVSLIIYGGASNTATPSSIFRNGSSGNTQFTGGAGILQIGTQFDFRLNQTSTAAFTAIDILITEASVGTGVQYLINAKAGAAGTTQVFSVSNKGGIACTAVSPAALAAGATADYSGLGQSTYARLTPDAGGTSSISGFLATNVPDGRMVVIVNIGAANLSITNQDAGSTAANRVITIGGGTIVVAANGIFKMIYDLTTARWRQI